MEASANRAVLHPGRQHTRSRTAGPYICNATFE
jgi:hypothetical protein